jgi:NACalpha-BTF3-like transcription factor
MGGWCKERYNKDESNKLEGLHHKPDQMEETRWEGQNFSEVLAPQEVEEEEEEEEEEKEDINKGDIHLLQSQVLNLNAVTWTHLTESCYRRITLV